MIRPTLDEVKNEGIRKHLIEVTSNCLWTARRAAEEASKMESGKFADFAAQVKMAREALADAERFYTELQNYQ